MDNLELSDELAESIDALMRSRGLTSRAEVVREAVERLVEEERARKLEELRAALQRGLDDIEAGRVKPAEEVFERLINKYRAAAAGGTT